LLLTLVEVLLPSIYLDLANLDQGAVVALLLDEVQQCFFGLVVLLLQCLDVDRLIALQTARYLGQFLIDQRFLEVD
jgi:hypothetical protein